MLSRTRQEWHDRLVFILAWVDGFGCTDFERGHMVNVSALPPEALSGNGFIIFSESAAALLLQGTFLVGSSVKKRGPMCKHCEIRYCGRFGWHTFLSQVRLRLSTLTLRTEEIFGVGGQCREVPLKISIEIDYGAREFDWDAHDCSTK